MKPVVMFAVFMLMPVFLISCGRDSNSQSPVTQSGVITGVQEVDCGTANVVSRVTMSAFTSARVTGGNEYFSLEGCEPVGSSACSIVTVPVGGTVKWTNGITVNNSTFNDTFNWWQVVMSETRRWPYNGVVKPGEELCLQFTEPGTYPYWCAEDVRGTVIVQ